MWVLPVWSFLNATAFSVDLKPAIGCFLAALLLSPCCLVRDLFGTASEKAEEGRKKGAGREEKVVGQDSLLGRCKPWRRSLG